MSAGISNVYIGDASQLADLVVTAAKIAAGVVPAGSALTLVEAKTMTNEATADFATLGTHRVYMLFYELTVDTNENNPPKIYFNADTTDGNYSTTRIVDGAISVVAQPILTPVVVAGGSFVRGFVMIPRVPENGKLVCNMSGGGVQNTETCSNLCLKWTAAANLTRIRIGNLGTATFSGKLALYYVADVD